MVRYFILSGRNKHWLFRIDFCSYRCVNRRVLFIYDHVFNRNSFVSFLVNRSEAKKEAKKNMISKNVTQ